MTYPYEYMVDKYLDVRSRSGVEWQCLCPFHEDTSPSFSVNIAKGLFICYACGAKGHGEALAKKLGAAPQYDPADAMQALRDKLEAMSIAEQAVPQPLKRVDGSHWTSRFRIAGLWLEQWHERMGDEFTEELADKFALGYDIMRHSLVIPIFDWDGSAEACVKRRLGPLDGGPKYLYSKGFKTSQHLYGAWQVRADHPVRRPKRVAVVEGSIDALSLWAAGIPAVALLGSQVSQAQKRLLHRLDAVEYVAMTDRDTAGAKAEMMLIQALRGSGSIVSRPQFWPTGCKDVAEMSREDRQESFGSARQSIDRSH